MCPFCVRLLIPDVTTLRSQDSPSGLLLAIGGTTQHHALSLSVIGELEWLTVQEEERQNRQLLTLSNQILEWTKAIHAQTRREAAGT